MLEDLRSWAPDLWAGTLMTIGLSLGSMCGGLVIALLIALGRISNIRWLDMLLATFVEIIRGSPLILQLFYIYYVFPSLGVKLTPIEAGLLGISINYGAYLSEVFRSGIAAVQRGQWESALALGMSRNHTLRRIILPQAFRIVIPPIGNYFIALFKDTALVSTISIADLMFKGQLLANETFQYIRVYTTVFAIYIVISVPASRLVRLLEKRLSFDRQ